MIMTLVAAGVRPTPRDAALAARARAWAGRGLLELRSDVDEALPALFAALNARELPATGGGLVLLGAALARLPAAWPASFAALARLDVRLPLFAGALPSLRAAAGLRVVVLCAPLVAELPALPPGVEHVDVSGCSLLERLPDGVASAPGLCALAARGCVALTAVPAELLRRPRLRTLDLAGCGRLVSVRGSDRDAAAAARPLRCPRSLQFVGLRGVPPGSAVVLVACRFAREARDDGQRVCVQLPNGATYDGVPPARGRPGDVGVAAGGGDADEEAARAVWAAWGAA
jgi:hypothetical protein